MDPVSFATTLTQFGVAGLIGWLWLTERRAASERERHLAEAHERLSQERVALDAVLAALRDNTRVLGGVEATLRGLGADLAQARKARRAIFPREGGGATATMRGEARTKPLHERKPAA
jgi:hypothetical protein